MGCACRIRRPGRADARPVPVTLLGRARAVAAEDRRGGRGRGQRREPATRSPDRGRSLAARLHADDTSRRGVSGADHRGNRPGVLRRMRRVEPPDTIRAAWETRHAIRTAGADSCAGHTAQRRGRWRRAWCTTTSCRSGTIAPGRSLIASSSSSCADTTTTSGTTNRPRATPDFGSST